MSVIYIQGGGGGGTTVQDATTTVKGIVRLATIQEAQGNYQDIAVTPAGVQQAIAGIVGGMTFKGSYDVALATPALENAEQGDYYVVSNVKVNPTDTNTVFNRFGQEWAVGDHLVIKEDMGGTIDDAKILKVDNTEKVAYLNDLLDVTESLASAGHVLIHDGADYKNRALTTADIVGLAQHLYALLDVSLNELTSATYTTSTTSLNLVHSKDYTIDIQGLDETQQPPVQYVKTLVLPTSLNDDHDEIRVVNLGDGALELQVAGSAVFHVAGNQSTTPISVTTNAELNIVGEVRTYTEPDPQDPQQTIQVNKVAWSVAQGAIPSRMSLVREGNGDWTNGFLTSADIVGVVSQGQLESLQQEVDRTQDGAGLNNDGSLTVFAGNYINGNTTLRQAIVSLDSALKSEETARISADNAEATTRANADAGLQSQIIQEINDRTIGDSNLQSQINALATIATTGASADASVAHTAVAYTPTSADAEAHIVAIDATLNSVLSTNVLSVNSETPTLGDVFLDGTHIDTTTTANNYTVAGAQIDQHLDGIDGKLGQLQTDLNTEVSDRTSGDSNLQGQINALATVATTGSASDVSVAHTALSYTPTSADVEAHIVGLDAQVNTLGSQIVTDVNGEAPVNGSVTLDGTHIDTLTTASNYTVAGASFDEHLDGVDTKLGDLQSELDATQTGAGLGAGGAYSANAGANYIASATSLKVADNQLDTAIDGVQTELDDTQTGAGLNANGTYTANGATNYISTATSLKNADELLDAQIALIGQNNVASVNSETPVNGNVTLDGTHIDTLTTANNYTVTGASFDQHLDGIDTKLGDLQTELDATQTGAGLANDGTYVANGSANYIASATSLKNADNLLDGAIKAVQDELDDTQTGAGLNADGTYSAPTGTKHLGASTSLSNADVLLDTALTTINATNYTGLTSDTLATHLGGIDTAIGLKAPIDSPTFTTSADAPTPTAGDNSTSVATTAFVQTELANLTTTAQGTAGTVQMSDGSSGFSASQWEFDTTNGHLLPKANDTYDIGEAENKVRDLYLGSNSLKFADDAVVPNVISVGLTDNQHPLGENLVQMTDGVIPVVYRDLVDVGQGGNGYADIEDLTNPNMLAKVASTGKYTDLTDTPQSVIASSSFDTVTQTYQLEAGNHHTFFPPSGDTFTLVVPDSLVNTQTSGGDAIRITNWGNGTLKITTSGSSANTWIQYSQTLSQAQTGGGSQPEVLIESRTTVDLYGWSYSSGGTTYDPAWGVYFAPSMEINTKSLTTSGQMLVYDATNDELVAGGLGDLNLTYTPTNYDNTLGGTVTGDKIEEHLEGVDNKFANISLAELTDVNDNITPVVDQILLHDGADFKMATLELDALTDVDTSTVAPVTQDRLVYDGTHFVPVAPTTVTTLTASYASQVIKHQGIYLFHTNATLIQVDGPTTAPDGTILIYNVLSGQILLRGMNGNAGALLHRDGTSGPVFINAGARRMYMVESGTMYEITASQLGSLEDVDLTSNAPSTNDYLKYNGTKWVPSAVTASVASIDDIGDVDTTTTAPQNGYILEWNGTSWVPVAQSGGTTAPTVTATPITADVPTLATPTDIEEIYVYTPNQNLSVNLASASNCGQGFKYQIKNMSANTLSIVANGSDTIDGVANTTPFDLTVQYSSVTLVSDGTSAWYII